MSKRKSSGVNIFNRFWRLTGGGFMSGFLIVLALTCLILLIGIEIWSRTAPEPNDTVSAPAQTETMENTDVDKDEDEDGWINALDEGDTTNIGNRVNASQLPDSSFIYEVSIEELANADSYLDGQTVQVTGEVVGDRITSEDNPKYCWITLQSQDTNDDNEISVYMSKSASKAIDTYGAFGKEGTHLQVRGTFYLASEDHQGTSEIKAESVSVVSPGEILTTPRDPKSVESGVALILIGSVLMLLFNILRERQL